MNPQELDRLINAAEVAERQRNGRQPSEPDCWSGGWPCGLPHHTADAALSVPVPWSIEQVLEEVEIRHLILTELRGTAAADPSFARKRLDAERALQPWTDAAAMWTQRHDYALGVAIMLPFLRNRIEGRPPASLAGGLAIYAAELGDDYDDSFDDDEDLDDEDLDDDREDLDDDDPGPMPIFCQCSDPSPRHVGRNNVYCAACGALLEGWVFLGPGEDGRAMFGAPDLDENTGCQQEEINR